MTKERDFLGFKASGAFGVLLALFWTFTTIPFYLRGIIVTVLGNSVIDYVIPAFFIFATIISFSTIIKATRIWDYVFMLALVIFFLGCYVWYPKNKVYLMEYETQFLFWSLPFFLLGVATNFQKCQRMLYVLSVLSIFLQLLSLFSSGVNVNDSGELEDIGRAFGIVPSVLFMIWKAIEDKSSLSICMAVLGVLEVVFMGTRGPLVAVTLFLVIFLLFFCKFKHPARSRTIIIILSFLGFLIIDNSIEIIMNLSSNLGFSTRALEAFAGSKNISELIVESSGRDIIYENLIDAIRDAPFWGYGPAADRIYSDFYEVYAHNIILEMFIEYGVVPGSMILLSILALIIIAIRNCKDHDTIIFLLIFVFSGFVGLFANGVYWTSRNFFFLIGLCVSVIRNSKRQLSLTT